MRRNDSDLAHKFARHICGECKSFQFRKVLLKAPPQEELKDPAVQGQILEHLNKTLKAESVRTRPVFDYEGNRRRRGKSQMYYPIIGMYSFPDAAILSPFKCAFEFDRQRSTRVSEFRDALMKASVHVFSGKYQSSILFYVVRSRHKRQAYLDNASIYTRRLKKILRDHGLYVALIRRP